MSLSKDQILDLVVALLATYNYSLDKAWALRDALEEQGFSEPKTAIGKKPEKVGNLLKKAGYDRGGITYIIAPRVTTLMEAIKDGSLDSLKARLKSQKKKGFCEDLQKIKGFGPKSAGLAWELMSAGR